MTALPLAGYRVLELAHLIAGPACGMYLADMGADVVKIEHPAGGDASRTAYGSRLGGESAVFVTVNRNKRSVALDLARPEGRAAFERLVAQADVVIEAYRGGAAERLGIDWARLAPLNPRLVYPRGPGATSPAWTCSCKPWAGSWPSWASPMGRRCSAARPCSTPSARSWPARASSPRCSIARAPDRGSAWTSRS